MESEKQNREKERIKNGRQEEETIQSSQTENIMDFIMVMHRRESRNGSRVKKEKENE